MKWQNKLTKKERAHLREVGAVTLQGVRRCVLAQSQHAFPCWECVQIGKKLGIKVDLVAWRKRCEEDQK